MNSKDDGIRRWTKALLMSAVADAPAEQFAQFKTLALKLVAQAKRAVYSLGLLWNELVRYVEDGHPVLGGAAAWWEANVPADVTPRMARTYGHVASAFDQAIVDVYPVMNLAFLASYASYLKLPLEGDPGGVQVSWLEDGETITLPFRECHVRDLQIAARQAKKRAYPPKNPLPGEEITPEMQKVVDAVADKLDALTRDEEELIFDVRMKAGQIRVRLDCVAEIFAEAIRIIEKAGLDFSNDSEMPRPARRRRPKPGVKKKKSSKKR
jgi:hypothetical protein